MLLLNKKIPCGHGRTFFFQVETILYSRGENPLLELCSGPFFYRNKLPYPKSLPEGDQQIRADQNRPQWLARRSALLAGARSPCATMLVAGRLAWRAATTRRTYRTLQRTCCRPSSERVEKPGWNERPECRLTRRLTIATAPKRKPI